MSRLAAHLATARSRARFALRMRLAATPVLYGLVVLVNWRKLRRPQTLVGAGTELVMDGYPGSGNSFAIAAFKAAGGDHVAVSHHIHSPQQIRKAVRLGLPTLVLVRPPRAAVMSLVGRWPYNTVRLGLRTWVSFHEHIVDVADGFVTATFEQVTGDFGEVLRRVNTRFGTDLPVFDHTPETEAALYDPALKSRQRHRDVAASRRDQLDDPAVAPLLRRAEALYQRFEALAAPSGAAAVDGGR